MESKVDPEYTIDSHNLAFARLLMSWFKFELNVKVQRFFVETIVLKFAYFFHLTNSHIFGLFICFYLSSEIMRFFFD